jgi:hypothetical protein
MSLLLDNSLNCHNLRLMVGVMSSLTILSVILRLGYTRKGLVVSTDRAEGPLSINN